METEEATSRLNYESWAECSNFKLFAGQKVNFLTSSAASKGTSMALCHSAGTRTPPLYGVCASCPGSDRSTIARAQITPQSTHSWSISLLLLWAIVHTGQMFWNTQLDTAGVMEQLESEDCNNLIGRFLVASRRSLSRNPRCSQSLPSLCRGSLTPSMVPRGLPVA